MKPQLEHRLAEANITFHAMHLHPEDIYLQLRYHEAVNNLVLNSRLDYQEHSK